MDAGTRVDAISGRRSGRTQVMIDALCDAVAAGQPRSMVVGHSSYFLPELARRIMEGLERRGIKARERHRVIYTKDQERVSQGLMGVGEFWDHEAVEQASPQLLAESDERISRGQQR